MNIISLGKMHTYAVDRSRDKKYINFRFPVLFQLPPLSSRATNQVCGTRNALKFRFENKK